MESAPNSQMDGTDQKEGNVDPEDEENRTLFCANLCEQVTEEILYELFIQSGPIESVRIPKDKDGRPRQFAFVTFAHACSVPYALELYEGVRLFRRNLVIKFRNQNSRNQTLGKRRRFDSNSLPGDKSPPPNSDRPWRDERRDEPRESKRRFSPDRSSLRMGQGGSYNRLDMNMQPSNRGHTRSDDTNQYTLNDLERFGANMMFNSMKGPKNLFEDAIKGALSNDNSSRQYFDNDRSTNHSRQGRHSSNPNPFRNNALRGFSDHDRGRPNGDRKHNRGQKRRR